MVSLAPWYPTAHPIAFSNCLHLALSEPSLQSSPWNYARALKLSQAAQSSLCQVRPDGSLRHFPSHLNFALPPPLLITHAPTVPNTMPTLGPATGPHQQETGFHLHGSSRLGMHRETKLWCATSTEGLITSATSGIICQHLCVKSGGPTSIF